MCDDTLPSVFDDKYRKPLLSSASYIVRPLNVRAPGANVSDYGQSGDLIEKVRGVLGEAKGDGFKTDGNERTDDTAIVQSVGAPFAALQWRKEDSLNNFRCVEELLP